MHHRRAVRIDFDQEVTCSIGGKTFKYSAQNLSVSGILLHASECFPLESRASIHLALPTQAGFTHLDLQGKVYRSDAGNLGVTFLDLDWNSRNSIAHFVQQQSFFPGLLASKFSRWEIGIALALLGILLVVLGFAIWKTLEG